MIITVEETLRAVPREYREASLALGATRLQTIFRVILPQAWSGVMTGAILAISRGAGEVAPVLFTGAAYFLPQLPTHANDQFMHLGYHIYVLSTQSPDVEATKPLLVFHSTRAARPHFPPEHHGDSHQKSDAAMGDAVKINVSHANFFYGTQQALHDVNVKIRQVS